MAWEDGTVTGVETLIAAADATSGSTARGLLNQALGSAKCISDERQKKNFIALIEDKLRNL